MRDLDPEALEGFRRQVAHYARNAQVHIESLKDLQAAIAFRTAGERLMPL